MHEQNRIISLSFFRFAGPGARLWAFAQMGLARRATSRLPGIGFWKLLGSGTGEGFTPLPNTGVYAILATWPDAETARAATERSSVFQRYRRRSVECWTVLLEATSARGAWDGRAPFAPVGPAGGSGSGPIVALTRATLRPRILHRFWGRVPRISAAIGADPAVMFKIGLGEVPWFQQVTFSIWPDAESMADFARRDGPHAAAIRAVREGRWFSEELYARFRIVGETGTWNGASPLTAPRKSPRTRARHETASA